MQRAIDANVSVNHQIIGAFAGPGLVIFVGVTHTDSVSVAHTLAEKIYGLRIFDQEFVSQFDQLCVPPSSSRELSAGKLGLPMLVISQFTLTHQPRRVDARRGISPHHVKWPSH